MFLIHLHYMVILYFTFAKIEEVHKIRKGFGIIGAGASAEYYGVIFAPVLCINGYA